MTASPPTRTRRSVLKTTGGLLAVGGLLGSAGSATAVEEWTTAETPTARTLHDVVETAAGAYAVGGGGDVLHRTDAGWVRVLNGGPTGNGNDLYGAAATDDGTRLWLVGASGAIGEYDVLTGSLTDHSAPDDVTNNFNDVSVVGEAGEANVYIAGDSGKIYRSFDNGATGTWDQITPGSGSAIHAIDFHGPRSGHAVDGNQTVFETTDGTVYQKIGIADANVNFYALDSDATDSVSVAGGGGMVHRWDGARWTPTDLGDASLRDIEVANGTGYVVGSGGVLFALGNGGWTQAATPTGANLKAVRRGDTDIAVGASGTVIEK
ncbi:MAG: WD40/YVTN/BNR-like repeat-containing protein [Halolamina sp.]